MEDTSAAEKVLVLGFVSDYLQAEIPNRLIGEYVTAHENRMLGFAGLDPTRRQAPDEARRLYEQECFCGLTLSPACQGFHPCDTRAMRIYELAEELRTPLYFLQGESLPDAAILAYAQPVLLDEVARTFPSLTMVISHLGFPWVEQTLSLLAKHDHVYADIAGLISKPWQAYRMLTLAYEYGVIEKLLFASDFPSCTVKSAAESLYNLNKITLDSVLPAVPREQLRSIVERNSLMPLGLAAPSVTAAGPPEVVVPERPKSPSRTS